MGIAGLEGVEGSVLVSSVVDDTSGGPEDVKTGVPSSVGIGARVVSGTTVVDESSRMD